VNDYQKEISDLEARSTSWWAEGHAKTIAELSMQLEILKAIYARAMIARARKEE